jgi:carbohydrate diacid regulator
VIVVDAQGIVIASSEPQMIGLPAERLNTRSKHDNLRLSLSIQGQPVTIRVGESHDGEVISTRLARAFVELAVSQLDMVERPITDSSAYRDKFIYDVLHGVVVDDAVILREAKLLGLNMVPQRAVILIDARQYILATSDAVGTANSDLEVQRRAKTVIQSIVDCLLLPDDTICAYIGDGKIAVLKASNTRHMEFWTAPADGPELTSPSWTNLVALKRAARALLTRLHCDTGTTMSIGLGRYHPGLHGLARSYQDARVALSLGKRFHSQNNVHCLDELGVAAFVGVADEQTKIELATHLLSPLSHAPELLETLEVFFARNCLPSPAANQLSIHRNTLSHRLDKITALTGLDPRLFDNAIQIRLALLLREFQTTD